MLELNKKINPENPEKADEAECDRYWRRAEMDGVTLAQGMMRERWNDYAHANGIVAAAIASGDMRPGAKPPDWYAWSGCERPPTAASSGVDDGGPEDWAAVEEAKAS